MLNPVTLSLLAVYISLAVFGYEVKTTSLVIGNTVAALALLVWH